MENYRTNTVTSNEEAVKLKNQIQNLQVLLSTMSPEERKKSYVRAVRKNNTKLVKLFQAIPQYTDFFKDIVVEGSGNTTTAAAASNEGAVKLQHQIQNFQVLLNTMTPEERQKCYVKAVMKNNTQLVKLFLAIPQYNCFKDIVLGGSGNTSLMWAVELGHCDMVLALVEAGADPFITDFYGKTAQQLAWEMFCDYSPEGQRKADYMYKILTDYEKHLKYKLTNIRRG